jgi:hypothetical protein
MAVDEFGREIPAGRGGRRERRSPSPFSPSRAAGGGGGGDGAPTHLYGALPTSRYGRDESRPAGAQPQRKRKQRSESPERERRPRKNQKPHASTLYSDEPMLCQFLWKETKPDQTEEEYDEYRRSYCLNYIRTFFNDHMDDSWFRRKFSPLEKKREATQERQRAAKEAQEMQSELQDSLAKQKSTDSKCFFIMKARLGGGIKQPRRLPGDPPESPTKLKTPTNQVPTSHVLSLTSKVLPILEVPPHVTDEQLKTALMTHCSQAGSAAVTAAANSMQFFSSSPSDKDLSRTAYLHCPEEIAKDIIQQLNSLDRPAAAAADSHVPRKEEAFVPKTLELTVECSDVYGRLEVDADGKGGAPEEGGVTPRKATVWVSTQPLQANVQVLSAAVSSKKRIREDKEAAISLALALDIRRNIPAACRLDAMLSKAFLLPTANGSENSPDDDADALDLSIAYLRRIHLFSFYNGCQSAKNVGDVLSGNHAPTSTIHLRLAIADDILQNDADVPALTQAVEDGAVAPAAAEVKVDMLVQRLNDSIAKALEEFKKWEGVPSNVVVSPEIDAQADELEVKEGKVEPGFLQDHAMIDEDGRARCSFHFCRKLFKDSSFLRKHLVKKHHEFLQAEVAKCHDPYMMKAWDAEEQRPVPPILVDCGRAFKVVPSPVLGAADPLAADPEPELWRRQEERRKLEEEDAAVRRERYEQHHRHRDERVNLDGALPTGRGEGLEVSDRQQPRQSNFVDVDDMKQEKVEMAFDNVEIPMQPPNKKKKKRKLL